MNLWFYLVNTFIQKALSRPSVHAGPLVGLMAQSSQHFKWQNCIDITFIAMGKLNLSLLSHLVQLWLTLMRKLASLTDSKSYGCMLYNHVHKILGIKQHSTEKVERISELLCHWHVPVLLVC